MYKHELIFLLIAAVSITVYGDDAKKKSTYRQSEYQFQNNQLSETDTLQLQNNIASGVFQLAQRLVQRSIESNSNKFEVLSPISIASALQLVLLGAKGNTYQEIAHLMSYGNYSSKFIHQEFGSIIKDLKLNTHNPKRHRVNWRKQASDHYIENYLKRQSAMENFEEHKIEVANGIFIQNDVTIGKYFKEAVQKTYSSEIEALDFRNSPQQASQKINAWVNEKTHGKITDIVPPVMNPNTRVVLANALYFNAGWQQTFFEKVTMPRKFFPNGRDKTDDYVMFEAMAGGGDFPHYFDQESQVDILGMPYKQNCTTMYVLMPRSSSTTKIKEIQRELTAEKIEKMIENMMIKPAVMLFPKMHLKSGYYLKPDLEDLDVKTLFNAAESDLSLMIDYKVLNDTIQYPEYNETMTRKRRDVTYKAESENKKSSSPLSMKDFFNRKRIVKNSHGKKNKRSKRDVEDSLVKLDDLRNIKLKNPHLYADEVIHKVDLVVNEKGTEGGASTVVTINRTTSVTFRVDQPFLFLIRHDPTKIILFYGVVFEPPSSDHLKQMLKEREQA